jgi:predicted nucleic acid-binding protein
VSYRLRVVDGAEPAEEAVRAIRNYEHVESLPLVDEVANYAAELRHDYYGSGERELSYADAIHLATAVVHDDCGVLYTGDPDFEGVDEIKTVVL